MFEFCITSIAGWVGSRKTTNLALRNFEIVPYFIQNYTALHNFYFEA